MPVTIAGLVGLVVLIGAFVHASVSIDGRTVALFDECFAHHPKEQHGASALRLSSEGGFCRTTAWSIARQTHAVARRCSVSTVFLNYLGSQR